MLQSPVDTSVYNALNVWNTELLNALLHLKFGKLCIVVTVLTYVFHMNHRTNSDYSPTHHWQPMKTKTCFLWRRGWIIKYYLEKLRGSKCWQFDVWSSVSQVNFCWSSSVESFLVPSPLGLTDHILLSHDSLHGVRLFIYYYYFLWLPLLEHRASVKLLFTSVS
jgi:hypothetical protein